MKLSDIKSKAVLRAPRIVLFGSAGIGKTTMGASLPDPIFVQTEDGLGKIAVDHFPLAETYEEVISALDVLINEDHQFKSVVIDSVDWLESLIYTYTCQKGNVDSIEQFGYGKGYMEALTWWRQYIDRLNTLRNSKGMLICQLAHARQVEVRPPNTEPYHQWQIKLHKHSTALIKEHCDLLGYCDTKTTIVKSESASGRQFQKTKSDGKRFIYCNKAPERDTKNRYGIDKEIEMSYDALKDAIAGKKEKPAPKETPVQRVV